MRSRKTDTEGSITYYVGDHYEIINGTITRHIFAGGMRIASISSGTTLYYHKDHLGSTSAVTDGSGNIVETTEYKPFGGLRDYSGSVTTNYKYTDQEFDPESGLYNYNARLYDPALGRFISADTLVQSPFSPQTLNRYSYVGNNPLIIIDETGHFGFFSVFMGGLIGGILSDSSGGDFWQGFVSGAISGAIFGYAGDLGGKVEHHIMAGFLSGGIDAAIQGGDIALGMTMGAFSGGFARYIGGEGGVLFSSESYVDQIVGRVAVGGIVGGVTAELFGGDFGTGFTSGIRAAGIGVVCNDIAHRAFRKSGLTARSMSRKDIYEDETRSGFERFQARFERNMIDTYEGMATYPTIKGTKRAAQGTAALVVSEVIGKSIPGADMTPKGVLRGTAGRLRAGGRAFSAIGRYFAVGTIIGSGLEAYIYVNQNAYIGVGDFPEP